ncbi:alpha/beta fold hydrolase [Kordiimonas sp. SCSIO 12610]|uniref:alpha/beta fold hydrolase n=1 Tax=Kordiimonas sp. SCSIO 12610 TaxID=2829597 RepID=UPI00210CC4B2|nr:alpha/beta hydrolase [Kordiimonas sp. SCSIO 12610]UTW54717.1 alpha/beta hydrolase [Kordiimonas sp. SCSIO 12610]
MMKRWNSIILTLMSALFLSTSPSWSDSNSETNPLAKRYMLASDQIMDIAGAKVRIRIEGPESAQPIILLHGFSFSLESWDTWATDLKKSYRVIRYDLLGHGLTGADPQTRYAPNERAHFLDDVMQALDIDNAILGGNSLGGLVAWKYALKNPNSVKALILVAPGGYSINGVTDKAVEAPAAVKAYFRNPSEIGVQYSLSRLYANPSLVTPERIKQAKDMLTLNSNGEELIKSIAEFTLPDPTDDLSNINTPTLILWGAKDMIIPNDHGERFENALMNSKLIEYDNAGHILHEEIPETSIADVLDFLNTCY